MDLEPLHNWAIRDEIGDRLRALLSREQPALPQRLRHLLDRFDEADRSTPAATPATAPRIARRVLQKPRLNRQKRR